MGKRPGALSSSKGSDFKTVLEAFCKTEIPMPLSGKWANAGMVRSDGVDLAWVLYNAQYFGVPQRRRRIFLVCDFRGESAAEILFVPKSLSGYFAASGKAGKEITANAESCIGLASRSASDNDIAETARTLDTNCGDPRCNQGGMIVITPKAAAFIGGAGAKARSIGYSEDISPTLKSETSPCVVINDRNAPLVAYPEICGTLLGSGAGLSRTGGIGSETDLCVSYNNPDCNKCCYIVRRLMPIECERLQGYPDGWTEFGEDLSKPISDTKRYEMLGNSVAVPCIAYIMLGISEQLTIDD